jgi:signal transduction histidine kinase
MIDKEAAFRSYVITRQEVFLKPGEEAEAASQALLAKALRDAANMPEFADDLRTVGERIMAEFRSKRTAIDELQSGRDSVLIKEIGSGRGLRLSDALREDFRRLEDKLDVRLQSLESTASHLTRRVFWGLLLAITGTLILGLFGVRLLTGSITRPLAALQRSVVGLGAGRERPEQTTAASSGDEIAQLAAAYEEMANRITQQIGELEAIIAIGHEINMIGPDGLEGVLRRITDRAADLLQVDVCLVMLRNDQMGCWIVEAASGEWNDRLSKSVMLWEEFPVSVRAFETAEPAIGEDLRRDRRPEVVRRNLIGESMLSIPLLSQGTPFGVLVLLMERNVPNRFWNVRLAKGFAEEAATAIANARLYETVQQRGKGLQSRLRQLEHAAEAIAHDLKGPGERMGGLASLLHEQYGSQLDQRAVRWLSLIEENGKELAQRIESVLEVARVGLWAESLEAVDPALVIRDVLKQRAGELDKRGLQVSVPQDFPVVACHRAYLRQIFDNLVSNAIKFSGDRADPAVRISLERKSQWVLCTVSDNGIGIAPRDHERVFEPFVRLNPGTTKGSGIGLTIVRRIVELYGGRIWIESNEAGGCSVWFTLPTIAELSERPTPGIDRTDVSAGNGSRSVQPTPASASLEGNSAS